MNNLGDIPFSPCPFLQVYTPRLVGCCHGLSSLGCALCAQTCKGLAGWSSVPAKVFSLVRIGCTTASSNTHTHSCLFGVLIDFIIIFFIYLFIYLFLAVLGLRFCVRAFSSCGKWGPLLIAVRGPLTIVASLVAEHRLQTRRLSSCGSWA